jgi:3'(2'), 5'-bisphosphate nucleotidase
VALANAHLGRDASAATVLDWIAIGGADGSSRSYWTLDPIDGTKGFLRGDQYAIALALIEDGEVVLGVLGCPNLPNADGSRGAVFAADDAGCRAFVAGRDDAVPVAVARPTDLADVRFCESVEPGHSDHGRAARIAERLGITAEPYRIDSQCKYAAVARGDASIYLRLPTRADYREKIWDHAAGKLVVERAGGVVTDVTGAALDFRHGRRLEHNRGVIATDGRFHDAVVTAVAAELPT